jgi:putative ABC transport system permease protein
VVKDFHFQSLKHDVKPLIFLFGDYGNYISLKLKGNDIHDTVAFITRHWKVHFPLNPFEYLFLDDFFEQQYRSEQRFGELFTLFTLLAIFIACLGLFGLAAFSSEQRTKEIGIRKVMGASSTGIVFLFSRSYVWWVLLSNVLAWPLVLLLMNVWLRGFTYRIRPDFWIFLWVGCLSLLIALATVSSHVVKAAVSSPVKSLRYE